MDELREIEAIKQLKYRYFRCLDLKRWDELSACFVPEATCAYAGGKLSFDGRDRIMEFLRSALGRTSMLTAHHGHHPEIELEGPERARGVWALSDVVIDTDNQITIRGASYYRDEYVKVDGDWLFASTGYERIYEEVESRAENPSLRLTANLFGDP